ncbi:hypothetical protein [Fluviicola taffensis]|uniref:hypothetical protein n=1 Tax=Fluviicola taffensis TaxID=191579 RepID=UPI003137A332
MKKYLSCLLFSIFLVGNSFGQTIRITEDFPESGKFILGIWKTKIVSSIGLSGIFVVDTAAQPSIRNQVLLSPELPHKSEGWLLKAFVQGQFLYEIHYVSSEKQVSLEEGRRSILVKRDIETLKIVSQKELPKAYLNLKFCKSDDTGFSFCLGDTDPTVNPERIYQPKLSLRKVIPRVIYRFDFDLDMKWSFDFSEYDYRSNKFMNEWNMNEDGNLFLPLFVKEEGKLDNRYLFSRIDLLQIEKRTGSVSTIELDVPEWDFEIGSTYFTWSSGKEITCHVIVTKRFGEELPQKKKSGFYFLKWSSTGRVLDSKLEWFEYADFVSHDNREFLEKLKLNEGEDHPFEVLSHNDCYQTMPNGDIFFISDQVEDDSPELLNSKLLFMVSTEGKILWKKLMVYDEHRLYNFFSHHIDGPNLYFYSREYNENCRAGIYSFYPFSSMTDGTNINLYLRKIDLENGEVKSLVQIYPENTWWCEPEPFIFYDDMRKLHIARFKNPKKNLEKMAIISF